MGKDEEEMRRKTKNWKIIEGYKIWKKNTPLLYNIVIAVARKLEWPSLIVEWLPDRNEQPGKDCLVQTVILGTHAGKNEPNYYLMRAEVKLPLENSGIDEWYNYDTGLELRRSRRYIRKVKIVQKIKHERHVNRARCMPQKPFIIATKTVRPEVFVFDYRKHSDKPTILVLLGMISFFVYGISVFHQSASLCILWLLSSAAESARQARAALGRPERSAARVQGRLHASLRAVFVSLRIF